MSITVYGIKNCNTMKKAFDKLTELGVSYDFFDYKKQVLSMDDFSNFVSLFGEKVINKQGTTYRKLDDDTKAVLAGVADGSREAVYEIVKNNQSMLKRPIIIGEYQGKTVAVIGFDDGEYQAVFG
ncbi:arsenate reductase family protein [uncultured Moraxella sp.]|uniref:arsenate reductase family protein n=1 Tax=uncultured Moraxella sp. TaxID=263769 RepID=UPI0026008245|nr:arsenate reductase family protein [uncultured Moraxella sp.]